MAHVRQLLLTEGEVLNLVKEQAVEDQELI